MDPTAHASPLLPRSDSRTAESSLPQRKSSSGESTFPLPQVSPLMLRWFTWYCRRYIGKHFHSLSLSCSSEVLPTSTLPIVLYTNHASWWDPLVGLVSKNLFFPNRTLFAPMDASMLNRYRMFQRLGFFGVRQGTRAGAADFLRHSLAILQDPAAILAITPQSCFTDVRQRPPQFRPGLGHLAALADDALFLPVAAEYAFWNQRLPEIFLRFGRAVRTSKTGPDRRSPEDWTRCFEEEMTRVQNTLAIEVQGRNPMAFNVLLKGGSGQGGVYDRWSAWKARIRRRAFQKDHN